MLFLLRSFGRRVIYAQKIQHAMQWVAPGGGERRQRSKAVAGARALSTRATRAAFAGVYPVEIYP